MSTNPLARRIRLQVEHRLLRAWLLIHEDSDDAQIRASHSGSPTPLMGESRNQNLEPIRKVVRIGSESDD